MTPTEHRADLQPARARCDHEERPGYRSAWSDRKLQSRPCQPGPLRTRRHPRSACQISAVAAVPAVPVAGAGQLVAGGGCTWTKRETDLVQGVTERGRRLAQTIAHALDQGGQGVDGQARPRPGRGGWLLRWMAPSSNRPMAWLATICAAGASATRWRAAASSACSSSAPRPARRRRASRSSSASSSSRRRDRLAPAARCPPGSGPAPAGGTRCSPPGVHKLLICGNLPGSTTEEVGPPADDGRAGPHPATCGCVRVDV